MSKQNILITALFCAVIYSIAIADYANGAGPGSDPRCSGLTGAAFGLCAAAIAVECDNPDTQNPGCGIIEENFFQLTGETPPWTSPVDTLLAYYPLDGNVLDVSGNNYHGTVGGTEMYGVGNTGQAFAFNGASYVSTALDIDVSVQPQLTMGAWIYPIGSFDGQVLTHDDQGYDRSLLYSSRFFNPPALVAYDGLGDGSNYFSVPAGTGWQFVAVVYDQGSETVMLFVDGTAVTNAGQILGPSVNMFRIGNNESNGSEFFNGLVDDVFVVSGALSISELEQIRFNGVRSMFP